MIRTLALALCLVAQAPLAHAADDPAPDAEVVLARSHFQRGVALYRSGAYDAALAEFTRANEAAPNYRILYNLAQIQAQRHDYVASLSLFGRYLEQGNGDIPEARAAEVRTEMEELERRVSRLRVETNVEDGALFINDLPASEPAAGEPLRLNAGIYRLRVEKHGYVPATRIITLAGGDDETLSLELIAELDMDDVAPAPPPPPPLRPPPVDRTAFWTSLVATGVLTGASVTFGLLTRRANGNLDEQLGRYPAPRGSIEESRGRVRTYALLTDAFGVAAATALGLTTYFYLSSEAEPEAPAPASRLDAQLGPHGGGVTWSADF